MRVAVAVLMGLGILVLARGMLRPLTGGKPGHGGASEDAVPQPPPPNVRITFWCENCGTELLLVRKGSEAIPRHCAEPMRKREETARA